MTPIAKIFHRYISRLWRFSRAPFFADDPNPTHNETIAKIRQSSTEFMRRYPDFYCAQLVHIGRWNPDPGWTMPKSCKGYFVPNGDTVRPKWWDNTYNNKAAKKEWHKHGVYSTDKPGGFFSFYSMMPSEELHLIMDSVRPL